jgi:hypothetical protein
MIDIYLKGGDKAVAGYGSKGLQLNPDCLIWLEDNAGEFIRDWVHTGRSCTPGPYGPDFKDCDYVIRVRIRCPNIALMFKLAWGGK